MKILFLITRAELGGGQTHVADLLRGLREEFEVELGTGEEGYLTEVAGQLGVRWHLLSDLVQPIRPLSDLKALRQCVQLIRDVRPNLVHVHTSKAGVIGRLAARLVGVPAVFTAHTWCFAEGTSWKWKLVGLPAERFAARCCGRIINVSEANRALALRNRVSPEDHLVTIHNGIGDCVPRARHAAGVVPHIVMLARFSEQKAQSLLVEAVSEIRLPFKLSFVGNGPCRAAVEQQVDQAGLRDRVEFLGERRDIPEVLAEADVFALFTHWEGFPISILEAMRAGLPVIASSVNGVPEAVEHESTGLLVPPRDVATFRQGLERLLADQHLRAAMGAAGRRRFEREFTLAAMLRRTVNVYRGVATPGPELLVPGEVRHGTLTIRN